jgi:hypothetical protein
MTIPAPSAHMLALLTALLGSGSAQAAAPLPATPANLDFTILMDGDPIGHETYDFRQSEGRTNVVVKTQTDVKMLFLTFHYRHLRQEDWKDGQLLSLKADTDDDGTKHHVEAAAQDSSLSLTADGKPVTLSPTSLPLSLWNKALLSTDSLYGVIDAQAYHISVQDLGKENLTVSGKAFETQHYRIAGDVQRDLWYGTDGLLVQAAFERHGYPIKFIRN